MLIWTCVAGQTFRKMAVMRGLGTRNILCDDNYNGVVACSGRKVGSCDMRHSHLCWPQTVLLNKTACLLPRTLMPSRG